MSVRLDRNATATLVGVGLRAVHYADFLDGRPRTGWLEIHAENYFARGGLHHQILLDIAERYPISVHGVGLSLGSADGLDADHLEHFAHLVDELRPCCVSEHLAWSRLGGTYYNDLLPLPLTEESFSVVSEHVVRVQDRLGRQLLIENPSAYLCFAESTIPEPDFLAGLVHYTGCGILLDINNLFVSAQNLRFDPASYLYTIPSSAVGELHLAGHEPSRAPNVELLIDTHSRRIAESVWTLYAQALRYLGPQRTLIEWDHEIPALETLLAEARRAADTMVRAFGGSDAITA